jgi:hypothetical protein
VFTRISINALLLARQRYQTKSRNKKMIAYAPAQIFGSNLYTMAAANVIPRDHFHRSDWPLAAYVIIGL